MKYKNAVFFEIIMQIHKSERGRYNYEIQKTVIGSNNLRDACVAHGTAVIIDNDGKRR